MAEPVILIAQATKVHQEILVLDMSKIPLADQRRVHEHLIREYWFRESEVQDMDDGASPFGEVTVTYRRWK